MADKNFIGVPIGQPSATKSTAPTAERFTPEYFAGLGRSALQGIFFGTGDELEALFRSAVGDETYKQKRDQIRAEIEKFRSNFPVEAYGTEIAASVPSGVGLAGLLARLGIKGAVKQAGAGGALYGAGAAEEMSDVPVDAAAGGVLGAGLAKVAPVVSERAKDLMSKGIPLTIGQSIGGGAKRFEEAISSVPLVGDTIRTAQTRAVEKFGPASINEALKPMGVQIPMSLKGSEAFSAAIDQIGNAYQKALGFSGVPYSQTVDGLVKKFGAGLQPTELKELKNILNRELKPRVKDGKLTGQDFKAAQSAIRKEGYDFITSQDKYQKNLGEALNEVVSDITDALAKEAPDAASQLKSIDAAYSRIVPIKTATIAAEATEGVFSPAQLQRAIMREGRREGTKLARGEAAMQQFGRAGRDVLGPKLPDSGTATRGIASTALLSGLTGGQFGFPLTSAIGGALGASLYTPLGQAALRKGLPPAGVAMRSPAAGGLLSQQVPSPISSAQASSLEDMAVGGNIVGYETVTDRQGNPVTFAKTSDGRAVRVR